MKQLSDLIGDFPGRHKSALGWFFAKTGTDGPWPGPLPDGTLLATKAKGIYKPRWTEFALSVRQSLRSPYSDREPVVRADGTWSYLYFQEGDKRSGPDLRYSRASLATVWDVSEGLEPSSRRSPPTRKSVSTRKDSIPRAFLMHASAL